MNETIQLVRATTLSGFEEMARRHGQDPVRLMELAEQSPVLLQEPELYMAFEGFMRLMDVSAAETGYVFFGAELGLEQGLRVLGSMAYAMSTSFSLREAVSFFLEHLTLQTTGNIIRLQQFNERSAMLSCEIIVATPVRARQTLDHTVGLGIRMMRTFYGEAWKPDQVLLQHSASANERNRYRCIFGDRIQFDAELSGFTFDASLLDMPLPDADPLAHKMFKRELEAQASGSGQSLLMRLRSLIRVEMPNGECTIHNIARMMAMSPRSLQRRLKAHETSFHELVDSTRCQMAEHYLLNSELQLGQISELLAFSRASNLTHAFRRWHGTSPTEWRRRNMAAQAGA